MSASIIFLKLSSDSCEMPRTCVPPAKGRVETGLQDCVVVGQAFGYEAGTEGVVLD